MWRRVGSLVFWVLLCSACAGDGESAEDLVVGGADAAADPAETIAPATTTKPTTTTATTTAGASATVAGESGSDGDDGGTAPLDAPTLPGFEPLLVDATTVDGFGVFCGTVEFEGGTIDLGRLPVFTDDLSTFVDEQFMPEFELQWEEGLNTIVFHEIERTDERLHLLGESPHSDAGYREIAFDRTDGEWEMAIWGGCSQPQVVAPGWSISELRLDPEHEPNAESEHLVLWVTERECASGRLPEGRAVAPVVSERSTSIDLLVFVAEDTSGEGATCQGNPSFPIVVELSDALGDRAIRNVAFEPAIELEWPIPLRDSEVWISVVGDAPGTGRANAMLYRNTEYPEGLVLDSRGWQDFGGGPVTGFTGLGESITIEGFVTECGDDASCVDEGCVMEGDPHADEWLDDGGRWCSEFPRLGETCTIVFDPDPMQDALITVAYAGSTCSIEVERTPIG